jgi:hypothetical protein
LWASPRQGKEDSQCPKLWKDPPEFCRRLIERARAVVCWNGVSSVAGIRRKSNKPIASGRNRAVVDDGDDATSLLSKGSAPPSDISEEHLSMVLTDYAQRCEDHRRQISYYPKLVVALVGIIATSLLWVLDSEPRSASVWLLPIAVLVCEAVACFGVYVYWSSGLMRRYLTNIELGLARRVPKDLTIHSIDEDPEAELAAGFHYWTQVNPGLKSGKQIRYAVATLYVLLLASILVFMWLWGQTSPVYSTSTALTDSVQWLGLGLPVFSFGLFLWARFAILPQLKSFGSPMRFGFGNSALDGSATRQSALSPEEVAQLLIVDFEERNADYRAVIDNYPLFLTLAVTIAAGAVSLLLKGGSDWVYAFAPFFLLTIPYFLLQTYRQAKALRQYLVLLEQRLDGLVSSKADALHSSRRMRFLGGILESKRTGSVHEPVVFHIGFFRIVREHFWQRTRGSKVTLVNAGVAAAALSVYFVALAWMSHQAYLWMMKDAPTLAKFYGIGVTAILILLVANIALYFEASRVNDRSA